ncbi:MAG: amidohydrolase [Brooklawnia sp.]|nr:amidohydrolase [Brooklawnia sp.]
MTDTLTYLDQLVAWRRHLHQHPELSFEEEQTVAYIESELAGRLRNVTRLERLTPTSLVVVFETGRPGPKLGLRADIDGLAIQEDRPDLPFASRVPNRMHGCGHDAHAAVVMAACLWVDDHLAELTGQVHAIFQHAEETPPGGAREMVATGYFSDFDFIFGFHFWAQMPTGQIDIKDGAASSNSDLFEITINGRGAHASTPEAALDPVVAAGQLIGQLQTIVSRRKPGRAPAVVSTTWLESGSQVALNVIPFSARLGGSVRTTDPETRELVQRSMTELLAGLEAANPGMTTELDYLVGYDMVWNDPARTAIVRELAQTRWGDQVVALPPMLGGEDFAAFSQVAPACYVFIGAGSEAKGFTSSHHTPTFGIDEDAFGLALALAIDVLRNGPRLAAG